MDPEQQRVPMVQSAVVNAAPPYFPQNFEAPHGGKQQGGAAPPPMGAPDPWFVAGPQQPPVVVATVVAQPGYGMADSWPQNPVIVQSASPATVSWCGRKDGAGARLCACVVVALFVGAMAFLFVPFIFEDSDDDGRDGALLDSGFAAGAPPAVVCPTPSITHGSLVVDVDASQDGLPSDGRYHAGTAASVQCDPGFRHASTRPSIVLCWMSRDGLTAEWSRSLEGVTCESTQPPPPRPVVVQVRAQVYSPSDAAAAANRVESVLREQSGEQTVEVTSALTFPMSIDTIADGSPEREEFENSFRQSMAAELGGLEEDAIVVQGISGGSVVVEWALVVPSSVAELAASLVTTLAASETQIQVAVGGVQLSADTALMETPVVLQRPDVDCVGSWTSCERGCTCGECRPRVYTITTTGSGRGQECSAAHGSTSQVCEQYCVSPSPSPSGEDADATRPPPPSASGALTDAAFAGGTDADRGMNYDHAEYASSCEQQCHAPGGVCAEWGAPLHPCDACVESCSDQISWEHEMTDADWVQYESCELACHEVGAPCASSPACTGDGVALTDNGELRHMASDLANYQQCSWLMSCSRSGAVPRLSFRSFDLEAGWDYLYLYQGSSTEGVPAATLHGTRLPTDFVGTERTVRAQYTSDGSVSGEGFLASFECVDPSTVPPPPPDPCTTGIALTDGGTLEHRDLNNHQECEWSLTCSDLSLAPLVTFLQFHTEANYDYVFLYGRSAGEPTAPQPDARLHGSGLPRPFLSWSSAATVRYVSDGSVNRDGFSASFECVDPSTVPEPPPDPCRERVSLVDTGVIAHSELRVYQDCSWAMTCSDPELSPLIQFSTFETESSFDFLYIYDNSANDADEPAVEAPLWCPESEPQQCRMMCTVEACPAGQCNMREGDCCASSCHVYEPAECTGCCPQGAYCFAPDPPCCAERANADAAAADRPAAALHGGVLPHHFVASGSSAIAQYVSDGSVDLNGFAANFSCVDPDTVPPPPPDPCAYDPRTGVVTGVDLVDSGELNHARLANGQECVWRVSCSNAAWVPQITFSSFSTENNFDFLYLYDGANWADFDAPSLTLHGQSLPRPATASGSEAVARYVSDGSVLGDGFEATFRCIDPNGAQDEVGMVADSIVVHWRVCPMDAVVLVNNGCAQGDPHWDYEGMVCANDWTEQEAYCSYAHSPTSCVYCTEYTDDSDGQWGDHDGIMAPPDYYEPDVYDPTDPAFGGQDDVLGLLRIAGDVCPEQYEACESSVSLTADGQAGGCMVDVMAMIQYSEEPPPNSLAGALSSCMEDAMQDPNVVADVAALICGGDACCACTVGCVDDEQCMDGCFEPAADGTTGACAAMLYPDDDVSWGGGDVSDPCDMCIMGCDSMVDWDTMDDMDPSTPGMWAEFERCSNGCFDVQHGACGGFWNDATDLHPCDACVLGCHESGGDWLDGEIAMGRPFLLGEARSSAMMAAAVEMAACSASDWIVEM